MTYESGHRIIPSLKSTWTFAYILKIFCKHDWMLFFLDILLYISRLLQSSQWHGSRLPRIRLLPQQDRKANAVRMLMASIPNIQRNDGEHNKRATYRERKKLNLVLSESVILISVSIFQPNYTSIINTCNIWRNFDDIQDSWASVASVIDYYGDNQDTIIANAGPGHWNDPDMVSQ